MRRATTATSRPHIVGWVAAIAFVFGTVVLAAEALG